MKYIINIDEDNPIHADERETVYMDKDTGMTWTISNNGKKKMTPLEEQPKPQMTGWVCPVCGRGLSPFTSVCPCNAGKGWKITCQT